MNKEDQILTMLHQLIGKVDSIEKDLTAFKKQTTENFVNIGNQFTKFKQEFTAFKKQTTENFVNLDSQVTKFKQEFTTFKKQTTENFVNLDSQVSENTGMLQSIRYRVEELSARDYADEATAAKVKNLALIATKHERNFSAIKEAIG